MIDAGYESRELKVSWSRLREYRECMQKAARKAEGKKSPNTDIRNYFPGTVVDVCMRRWLSQPEPLRGGLASMVDTVLVQAEQEARDTGDGIVRWKHLGDKDEVRENCRECLTRLEPLLWELALGGRYWPAVRFREQLILPYLDGSPQRVWLVGEMDLLTEWTPQLFRVWDLKMTANKDYWRKTYAQLIFYTLAVWLRHKVIPEGAGLIQPMCPEQVLWFEFSDQDRRGLLTDVASYCSSVWRKEMPPKAGTEGCDRCEVRGACLRYAGELGGGRVPWPTV
jgi:hypothetical protein